MENLEIGVKAESCVRCAKCVRVCPSGIFAAGDDGIVTDKVNRCIGCGHCMAVCPTDSVVHSLFPKGTVHTINYAAMPKPEQVMLLCKMRRSLRVFTKAPIPETSLSDIVEAAHRAPTGSNMQNVEFTLITSPDKLKQVTDLTIEIFGEALKKLENPLLKPILKRVMPAMYRYVPVLKGLIKDYAKGNDRILRGATAVLLIHGPKGSGLASADCNLAYQNGSLMAEALSVGQFYTGFVCMAMNADKRHRIERAFGIEGKVHAGMALGMPALRYPRYIDRKPVKLKRF